LKAKGVRFKDEQPREEGWGFTADLLDPDGNPFTIHEARKPSGIADWAKTCKKA